MAIEPNGFQVVLEATSKNHLVDTPPDVFRAVVIRFDDKEVGIVETILEADNTNDLLSHLWEVLDWIPHDMEAAINNGDIRIGDAWPDRRLLLVYKIKTTHGYISETNTHLQGLMDRVENCRTEMNRLTHDLVELNAELSALS